MTGWTTTKTSADYTPAVAIYPDGRTQPCNVLAVRLDSVESARAMLTRGSRPLPIDRDENGEWRDVHGETEQHVPPDVLP